MIIGAGVYRVAWQSKVSKRRFVLTLSVNCTGAHKQIHKRTTSGLLQCSFDIVLIGQNLNAVCNFTSYDCDGCSRIHHQTPLILKSIYESSSPATSVSNSPPRQSINHHSLITQTLNPITPCIISTLRQHRTVKAPTHRLHHKRYTTPLPMQLYKDGAKIQKNPLLMR